MKILFVRHTFQQPLYSLVHLPLTVESTALFGQGVDINMADLPLPCGLWERGTSLSKNKLISCNGCGGSAIDFEVTTDGAFRVEAFDGYSSNDSCGALTSAGFVPQPVDPQLCLDLTGSASGDVLFWLTWDSETAPTVKMVAYSTMCPG